MAKEDIQSRSKWSLLVTVSVLALQVVSKKSLFLEGQTSSTHEMLPGGGLGHLSVRLCYAWNPGWLQASGSVWSCLDISFGGLEQETEREH